MVLYFRGYNKINATMQEHAVRKQILQLVVHKSDKMGTFLSSAVWKVLKVFVSKQLVLDCYLRFFPMKRLFFKTWFYSFSIQFYIAYLKLFQWMLYRGYCINANDKQNLSQFASVCL